MVSASDTEVVKSVGEARPLGVREHGATTQSELAVYCNCHYNYPTQPDHAQPNPLPPTRALPSPLPPLPPPSPAHTHTQ